MSQTEVESRIAALEKELNLLKAKVDKKADKAEKNGERPSTKHAWWKDHVGIFADDPAHEEAMRLGREWRESQREDYDKD
ncbi:MAG: hypothetical protein ACT4O9_05915 [Blastocatellia bacterium]